MQQSLSFSVNLVNQKIYETVVLLLKKQESIRFEIANANTEVLRINRSMLVQKLDQMLCNESQDFIY